MSNEQEPVQLNVLRGTPTAEELAAIMAVVSNAYSQEVDETIADDRKRSAWELSRRSLREPLRRELGWGRFGG